MELGSKELLFKDLSARLPYGVVLNIKGQDGLKPFNFDETLYDIFLDGNYLSINNRGSGDSPGICEIKPYLRPMSSMTEEEGHEYRMFIEYSYNDFTSESTPCVYVDEIENYINWLLAHHFDFRGLIEKGLAIEVTKENNPYETGR